MIAIVIIGYNREESIKRVYKSVSSAFYPENERVDLIFSIDKSDNTKVLKYVEKIIWPHGEKIVRTFPERQGLRKHIISCADFFSVYEALIILEDDVCVAEDFYNYTKQAVDFYRDDDSIAGISLYSHSILQFNLMRFAPSRSIYDNYFICYPASWGEVWLKKQFMPFLEWYEQQDEMSIKEADLPQMVKEWPESSWLKYHIAYCQIHNKQFVYPYNALSTNYSDAGQHFIYSSDVYQVELQKGSGKRYSFCKTNNSDAVKYDSFFENMNLYNVLSKYVDEKPCINLNQGRNCIPSEYRFCLTTSRMNKKIIAKFGLALRPIEENVLSEYAGEGIFLYDLEDDIKNSFEVDPDIRMWAYNCKGKSLPPHLLKYILYKLIKR